MASLAIPDESKVTVPREVEPSMNVTVPVGTFSVTAELTCAVNAIDPPTGDIGALDVSVMLVASELSTVTCCAVCAAFTLLSPLKAAAITHVPAVGKVNEPAKVPEFVSTVKVPRLMDDGPEVAENATVPEIGNTAPVERAIRPKTGTATFGIEDPWRWKEKFESLLVTVS